LKQFGIKQRNQRETGDQTNRLDKGVSAEEGQINTILRLRKRGNAQNWTNPSTSIGQPLNHDNDNKRQGPQKDKNLGGKKVENKRN